MHSINRKQPPSVRALDQWDLTEPEMYTLDNGIRVIQYDAGSQDLVRIELIFAAGSWYQEQNFLALSANLMLREGTTRSTSQEIASKLDYYGAHLETTAEKDHAYITLYTLNKHLAKTLPILHEIVHEASFPAQEFEVLQGKQTQLLQVNMQKVNFIARTRFNALIYGKSHPYGNYLETEDIGLVATADLASYYHRHYRSAGCTIMLAGKIDPSLKEMLQSTFGSGDGSSGNTGDKSFPMKPSDERIHFIPRDGALQSAIRMGKVLFNRHHPDYPGMKFLNTLLGGFFGSRLMSNLREDKGYTYGIGSAVIPLVHSGYFFISCETGSEVTLEAVEQIRAELRRLIAEPPAQKEMNLVRNYMLGSFLRGIDGPFALADTYRDVMEHGLDNTFHARVLDTIRTITPAQLQQLAAEYLDPESMHLLVVGKPGTL